MTQPAMLSPSLKSAPQWAQNLYPPLVPKVSALIDAAKSKGWDVDVQSAFRPYEEQGRLYAQGRTKPGKIVTRARPGQSEHNFGIAVDIVFRTNEKWDWSKNLPWAQLGQLGKSLGLEWGGDWKHIKDLDHFEWPTDLHLSQLDALYQKGGLQNVWDNL